MKRKQSLTKSQQRARIVAKLIEMTYSSLHSHLHHTYQPKAQFGKLDGDARFQKKCVKEYSQMIYLISELY